jgi:antitoxin component HigA of HigAB toxin-antitoxin module
MVICSDEEHQRLLSVTVQLWRSHGTEAAQHTPEHTRIDLPTAIRAIYPADPTCWHRGREQRGQRAADLTPIFGARSIASLVLDGQRQIRENHSRKQAEFFHVPPALFLA